MCANISVYLQRDVAVFTDRSNKVCISSRVPKRVHHELIWIDGVSKIII